MKRLIFVFTLLPSLALAQQPPPPVPFTGWRAQLDADLARLSMPRDAHQAVFQILQAYERQAQEAKKPKFPQPPPIGAPQPPQSPEGQ
jgi:hypothetical protein